MSNPQSSNKKKVTAVEGLTDIELHCIKFFGHSGGNVVKTVLEPGLDIFSPYPGQNIREAKLSGIGAAHGNQGLQTLHVLSVRRVKDPTATAPKDRFDRLSCKDFTPAAMNWSGWWSVPALHYEDDESLATAYKNFEEAGKGNVITTFKRLREIAEKHSKDPQSPIRAEAVATLRCFETMEKMRMNETKALSWDTDDQPLRFDLDRMMILYKASSTANDPDGYWTNTRNEMQGQAQGNRGRNRGGVGGQPVQGDSGDYA